MRALPVAAALVVGFTMSAAAQMVGPGMGFPGAGSAPNWNNAPPAPPPGQPQVPPQGQMPPCFKEFTPIRDEAQKRANVLKTAMQKKVPREEACNLIKSFSAAEGKVVKFVTANAQSCGIPPQAVTAMKANHDRTVKMETQVCSAANAPQRPTGPGLSEALGQTRAGTLDTTAPQTGGLDTLTGNVLSR